jgi:hypothetical protein
MTTFADISRSFMDPFHEFFPSHMSPGSLTHVLLETNRYNTSLAFLLLGHMSLVPPKPVLRIHDILVWIRIWIRGSLSLNDGSESGFGSGFGSCYFRH